MRIARIETIPVSVPYRHREVSAVVARDGVSDVIVKVTTDDGLVGWGEACCGADTRSVDAAIHAMAPLVEGRSPWNREAIRRDIFGHGLWQFRAGTGNFAWAGIDMALWDICGKAVDQPVWRLLGGLLDVAPTYFYYLAVGSRDDLTSQCEDGLARGYGVFYLKVGSEVEADIDRVSWVREALGSGPRIRIDANGAWTLPQAIDSLAAMAESGIDFVEQPVREHPPELLKEVRERARVTVCANEGLWSEADCYQRIRARQADVYNFSPFWVGGIESFHRLAWAAHYEGLLVCKHTHGELGLAAAAAHHVVLTLPNGVEGHQQTAQMLTHDILETPIPIASGPHWGVIEEPGLGVAVDQAAVEEAAHRYRTDGQYTPWQATQIGTEVH